MRSHSRRSTKQATITSDTATALAVKVADQQLEKERVLDEAIKAYHEQKRGGKQVSLTQFSAKFPKHRKSVRHCLEVEEAVREEHLGDEPWPDLYSHFLGFDIIYQLGMGAIARVYLATEPACGNRLVVVKVARGGHDEAETLGRLSHPNVVPVHSVQKDPDTGMTAVCMPYRGTETLADLWDRAYTTPTPPKRADVVLDVAKGGEQIVGFVDNEQKQHEEEPDHRLRKGNYVDGVVHLGIQMAEALEYTHENNVLHRDLKPSNVLLSPSGRPMLLDFNLATDGNLEGARLGGTLEYMPPEQIHDVHVAPHEADLVGDPRSDIFSLAVILYELLAGRLPFGDPPEMLEPRDAANVYLEAQQTPPEPLTKFNRDIDKGLAQTIERCLSLDPLQRPQSAGEFASALGEYFDKKRSTARMARRNRGVIALASIALLTLLFTAVSIIRARDPLHVRLYRQAVESLRAGNHRVALDEFDEARKVWGSETVPILIGRGYCFTRMRKFLLARGEYSATARPEFRAEYSWLLEDLLYHECSGYTEFKLNDTGFPWGAYNELARHDRTAARCATAALVHRIRPHTKQTRTDRLMLAVTSARNGLLHFPDDPLLHHLHAISLRELLYALKTKPRLIDEMGDLTERSYTLTNAIAAIEVALEGNSHPSAQFEAALIYGLAAESSDDFLPEFKRHLRGLVRKGYARSQFERAFNDWESEPWFQDLVSEASPDGELPQEPTAKELIPFPSDEQVAGWLMQHELWPSNAN